MPRYVLSGVNLDDAGVSGANLVLQTQSGVTGFSYEYLNPRSDDMSILTAIRGTFTLSYRGETLDPEAVDAAFANLKWGAGRATKTLIVEMGDQLFFAPVAGDATPNLTRDGYHGFLEFGLVVEATGEQANQITKGIYAADQRIALRDFFDGDLTGPVRQGTQGNDDLRGTTRDDMISGQRGHDVARGGAGDDTIMMGRGADRAYGGTGNDVISGYSGDDRLLGGSGHDLILGGANTDTLWGQGGRDTITGDGGNDMLFGGSSNDRLIGGDGADRMEGGTGNDVMNGGRGADRFVFARGGDSDKVFGFNAAQDTLVLNDNLWSDRLSKAQVLDRFAEVTGSDITLTFGGGDVLVLRGFNDLDALEGALFIL